MPNQHLYDVFICHSDSDETLVEKIAGHLEISEEEKNKASIKVWFEKWAAIPGQKILDTLAKGILESKTVAIFFGPGGIGPLEFVQVRAALTEQIDNKNFRVIPVLLPGALDKSLLVDKLKETEEHVLNLFLKQNYWVDLRNISTFPDWLSANHPLWQLESGILGIQPKRGRHFPGETTVTTSPSLSSPPSIKMEDDILRNILFKLNFEKQVDAFYNLNPPSVSAFYILGEEYYGHEILVKRILEELNVREDTVRGRISASSRSFEPDPEELLVQLGEAFELDYTGSEIDKISDEIAYKYSNKQEIVLQVDGIEKFDLGDMEELVQTLWTPFSRIQPSETNNCRLIFFFLQFDPHKKELINNLNSVFKENRLVPLPELTLFNEEDIDFWIRAHRKHLPLEIVTNRKETAKKIIEDSNGGIPFFVFKELCHTCKPESEAKAYWRNFKKTLI